jgi:anti-anti-sigma regulatory factor
MECRIQLEQRPNGCTVRLAGRLNAAQVHELRAICATATGPLLIDLTDLLSVDPVGIDALRRLRTGGAELTGVARYLLQWLV